MHSKKSLHETEPHLAQDLMALKRLSGFLRLTFKGSRFGDLEIDEAAAALDRVIGLVELEKK